MLVKSIKSGNGVQQPDVILGWLNKHLWGFTAESILPSNDRRQRLGGENESDSLA